MNLPKFMQDAGIELGYSKELIEKVFGSDKPITDEDVPKMDEEEKLVLSDLGLIKVFNEMDQNDLAIMTSILSNLTGLTFEKKTDLVLYIRQQNISDSIKYGSLVAGCSMALRPKAIQQDIMEMMKQLKGVLS